MAAYGSISGDIGPSDYWIVDYRIDHQIGSQKQRMPVKKKLNFAFLKKKFFKNYQDLSLAGLAVLSICKRIRFVLR